MTTVSRCSTGFGIGATMARCFCTVRGGGRRHGVSRASGYNGEIYRAAHGYEPTREAAMAAFAKSWRRS
jgi:hypothetical protein